MDRDSSSKNPSNAFVGTGDIKNVPPHPVEEDTQMFSFCAPINPPMQTEEQLRTYVTQLQLARINDLEFHRFQLNSQIGSLHQGFQEQEQKLKAEFQAKEQKWRYQHEVDRRLVMAELKLLLLNQNGSEPVPPHRETDSEEAAAELEVMMEELLKTETNLKDALKEKEDCKRQVRELTDEIDELKTVAGVNETNFRTQLRIKDERINQLEAEVETLKISLNTSEVKVLANKVRKKGSIKEEAVEATENQMQLVPSHKVPPEQTLLESSSSEVKIEKDDDEVEFLAEVDARRALVPVQTGGPPKPTTKQECKQVVLSSKGPQVQHQDATIPQRKFKCAKCPTRFYMFAHMRYHMKRVHQATRLHGSVGCSTCGTIFDTKRQHLEHRKQFHTGLNSKKPSPSTSRSKTRRAREDPDYRP